MSSLMRRSTSILSLTSLGTVATILLSSPELRALLARTFHPKLQPFRFTALLLAVVLNSKALPFVWHLRLFGSLIYQVHFQPTKLPKDALFRPIVTRNVHTPWPECDYNLHKSNSTYFADFDIARTQLLTCLLRTGIRTRRTREKSAEQEHKEIPKGQFMIALGGVSTNFKKEVKAYEKLEIWTRVLSWDQKWIYFVSHMVKAGEVKPDGWALQPGKAARRMANGAATENGMKKALEAEQKAQWKGAIFASSIAKYVVKKGRLTIPPELVLQNSNLLPPKPDEVSAEGAVVDGSTVLVDGKVDEANADDWTWERVETERLRGLELAGHFGALDGLHDEFPLPEEAVVNGVEILGEFSDFPVLKY